jgi:hypothetical protein
MRKRFMKSVLVGTLAVIASAIVVGSASGEQSSTLPKVEAGIPSGYASIPLYVRRTLGDPRGAFIPGYDDFPNVLRRQNKLTPTETRQLDAAVAQVTNTKSIPGYSDFPNALRLHNTLTPTERKQLDAAVARSNSKGSFVPGYTDFPNALRLHSTLTPTERKQLAAAVASTASVSSSGSDFSWSDAGVGIGIGLAIAGGLVAVSIVAIRRNRATPVPA